jgi:retron-type reverse transcriptase
MDVFFLEFKEERAGFDREYAEREIIAVSPGADGMTTEEAAPYLKEHKDEIIRRIIKGKYKPMPVRRVEIPKPDGGVRLLGVQTVVDRVIQQAEHRQRIPVRADSLRAHPCLLRHISFKIFINH